jgi:hypothetical protein
VSDDTDRRLERIEQTLHGTARPGDDGIVGRLDRVRAQLDRLQWWLVVGFGGVIAAQVLLSYTAPAHP